MRTVRLSFGIFALTSLFLGGCSAPSFSGLFDYSNSSSDQAPKNLASKALLRSPLANPEFVVSSGKSPLPIVPLNITPEVRKEIARYTTRNRGCITNSLNNRKPHHDLMKEIFRDEGVPEELINVALLESQFNPRAKSPAGAKGMWQFMSGTGRLYGLTVKGNKDERTDPILSTIAAAKHLRDLYNEFNDWHLALAAYNAGPARVSKALEKSGADSFWELARSGALPQETLNFVPKFIASTIIMQQPKSFGFADAVG